MVSVVVPCYNVEDYVRTAVQSAIDQTHRPLEIICVDDGSTDGTLRVLRELKCEHSGLVIVLAGPNGGAPAARNRGLRVARGEYIQFLDADDELAPEKLSAQVALAETEGADLVAGSFRRVEQSGAVVIHRVGDGSVWMNLACGRLGITSANLWRRGSVEQVGGWREEWNSSQEAELMLRLLKAGSRVSYDRVVRTTVYAREGSISSVSRVPRLERWVRLRHDLLKHQEAKSFLKEEEVTEIRHRMFRIIRALYLESPEVATSLHAHAIPPEYLPAGKGARSRFYRWAYKAMGFSRAEGLRELLRRGDD